MADQQPQVKALQLKDVTAEGKVLANVATLGVVDKVGDLTKHGFFGKQAAPMAWGHQWLSWIGKGTVYEDGDDALFDGQFFMDTQAGDEAFKTVRAMGDLGDWSYGYQPLPGGARAPANDEKGRRVLQPLADGSTGVKVLEVSPVLHGAGQQTGTVGIKGAWVPGSPLPTDQKFSDQLQGTVVAVQQAIERAQAIKELRDDEGKPLGEQTVALLADMDTALVKLQGAVAAVLDTDPTDPTTPPAVAVDAAQAARAAEAHMEQLVAGLPA